MSRFIITVHLNGYEVYTIRAASPEAACDGMNEAAQLISAVSIDEGKAWQFIAGKWEELE